MSFFKERSLRLLFVPAYFAAALLLAGTASVASAQTVFKVTTIPEEAASEQVRKFGRW